MSTATCSARCTTLDMPAPLSSAAAGSAKPWMASAGSSNFLETNGTLHSGIARGIHQVGGARTESEAPARKRASNRERSPEEPSARRPGFAAGTGRLRQMRKTNDTSLSRPADRSMPRIRVPANRECRTAMPAYSWLSHRSRSRRHPVGTRPGHKDYVDGGGLAGLPALSSTLLTTSHKSMNVELNIYQ